MTIYGKENAMKIVEDAALDQKVKALLERIPQEVDNMIVQLKFSLINPITRSQAKRGIWDRFKNTMSNLWWGRHNQDNPYFWKNKLGDDLGEVRPEHVMLRTIPIVEYHLFRNHCKLLENQLDTLLEATTPSTENLAITKIINRWGQQLKTMLIRTVKDHIYGAGGYVPASPTTDPAPTLVSAKKNLVATPEDKASWKDSQNVMVQSAHQLKDDGKISDNEFKQLIDAAQDGTNVEMIKFQKGWKLLNRLLKRSSPPDVATGSKVADSKQKLKDDEISPRIQNVGPSDSSFWDKKPNTGDRAWDDLSQTEKEAWNKYGGGRQRRIAKKELKGLELPWILRIGDPRIKIVSQRKARHIWLEFGDEERIELDSDPIKGPQDFEQRIEIAKKLKDSKHILYHKSKKSDVENLSSDTDKIGVELTTPSRNVHIPQDTMPPDVPKNQENDKLSRTSALVHDVDHDEALKEIKKAEKDGIISKDQKKELIDMVKNGEIEDARMSIKLNRDKGIKYDPKYDDLFDWVAPRNVLREKVEYYKKLLREGNRCVR